MDDSLGFLSVVEEESLGFVGGLLVVDRWARPLEFHCSTPVRPTRAQEILYGATLQDYLFGELIGGALVAKCENTPAALFVDRRELLGAGSDLPAAWLHGDDLRLETGHLSGEALQTVHAAASGLDLAEPFERIHQALREVHLTETGDRDAA